MNTVYIRKFNERDIENKIKWINTEKINKYLHYELPLELEKTIVWYEKIKDKNNRLDYVIEVEDNNKRISIGLIGLLDIDYKNKKGEFYICLGNENYHGKGIAKKASIEFLKLIFEEKKLEKVFLYTEYKNIAAQNLFEKIGFKKEGLLRNDLIYNKKFIDRYIYSILKEEFYDNNI